MALDVIETLGLTRISVNFYDKDTQEPAALIAAEFGFFAQLARMATRERIIPLSVTAPIALPHLDLYRKYFGVTPAKGEKTSITFAAEDAQRPFVTENEHIWNFFEPSLRSRLVDIKASDGFSHRVRAALHELLPSGQTAIDDVAGKLAVSKRTLQRRLGEEETNYQTVLSEVREELAQHYVKNSELPYAQI